MIYEDFVRTLLARMGLPYSKVDAGAVRDGVDRLVRLSAMVDDLLAEAGYDTMFDTREKCLEALRQGIKAKLGTTPVDREVLRLSTELADAWQKNWLLRDTIETQKKMRLDLAVEQDKLVAALDEAQNQLAAERKKWPELKAEVERLKKFVRTRDLTIALFEKIVLGHADPGAVMRDAETGETAHIASDVRAVLGRLSGLAAENRRLETLNAQIDIARDQHLRDLLIERRKNADASQIAESNIGLRNDLDKMRASDTDTRFKIAHKLLGMRYNTAPAWNELLVKLEERLKELTSWATVPPGTPPTSYVVPKPIDRDRIRLALLDFDPKVNTVGFINDLADHLVKRLS